MRSDVELRGCGRAGRARRDPRPARSRRRTTRAARSSSSSARSATVRRARATSSRSRRRSPASREWYVEAQLQNFRAAHAASTSTTSPGMRMRPMSLTLKTDADVDGGGGLRRGAAAGTPAPVLTGGDAARGATLYASARPATARRRRATRRCGAAHRGMRATGTCSRAPELPGGHPRHEPATRRRDRCAACR